MQAEGQGMKQAIAGAIAVPLLLGAQAANAISVDQVRSLTYEEVKGTGLANRCPEIAGASQGEISINDKNKFKIANLCLEPKSFQIEQEVSKRKGAVTKEFVDTKLMTRATYTLAGVNGPLEDKGGLTFTEKDGIDYAPATVQLPGGERVPFLFTVKNLVARSDSTGGIDTNTKFAGKFTVPSYRTGLFLDPKGRGTTTGYDQAVALPALQAGGDESMFKENNKKFEVLDGSIELKVTSVNSELGEIGGVFVHKQPSDTDLGSKVPKELLLKGTWFATVNEN
jgi:photosystem II oxygen-evolving enhancer protein 1